MTVTRSRWLAPLALAACFPSASPVRGEAADPAVAHEEPLASPGAPAVARRGEDGEDGERAPGSAARDPGASRLALPLLATLAVQARGPKLGYARDQYGPAWADTDRNGCDTRNDILHRDLGRASIKPGTHECVVLAGTLADPYTSTQIRFERGGASEVDVDHVVALGNAWVTGAADWPFKQRLALANDPLNLLAVEAAANRAKSDGDAATWLPPNHAYRCAYVARQIAVKAKYGLWVTPPEREAMATVLRACPDEPAPVGDAPTLAPINPPEPQPRPGESVSAPRVETRAETKVEAKPQTRATDPNYGTCKQAKANRAGPYVRGKDPEYAYYQDRDGDGVVCE
jgi:hypothetical protein